MVAPTAPDVTTATLGCIARFGLNKLTVEDVARASGRSRATLYRTYPSRRDLVASAVNAELDRIAGALIDAGRAAPTLPDASPNEFRTGWVSAGASRGPGPKVASAGPGIQ